MYPFGFGSRGIKGTLTISVNHFGESPKEDTPESSSNVLKGQPCKDRSKPLPRQDLMLGGIAEDLGTGAPRNKALPEMVSLPKKKQNGKTKRRKVPPPPHQKTKPTPCSSKDGRTCPRFLFWGASNLSLGQCPRTLGCSRRSWWPSWPAPRTAQRGACCRSMRC